MHRPALPRALLALALVLGACVGPRPRVVAPWATETPPHAQPAGDYSPSIPDEATWRALAASPGRQLMARTEVVKVILDLEDHGRVYFLQSERWEIHYFFAQRFLSSLAHPVEDHAAFNIREYRRDDRRFILGTLARYRDQDVWAFELIAGDTLDLPRTVRAFQSVRERVFFREALRYRPVPPAHEARAEELVAAGVPVVTTQTLFGATRYQPVIPGEAVGYLRFHHGEPDPARIRRTDIVVLDTVPLDLPVCAGVITSELQAPLGHVAVLAANRHTPDMALRGASADPALRALEGRLVRLHVTPQEWSVRAATQAEAERAWEARRPRRATTPPLSTEDVGLRDVRALGADDVDVAGAKAAQLGELTRVQPPVRVPRAFVVPFRAYLDHLARHGLDARLREALAREDFQRDPEVRASLLADLRERIARAPVDPALVERVRLRARELFPGARVRFRSSTNAEDLPGFNGAGLYRSVIRPADPDASAVADALREVWASVWSFQAHEERSFFRLEPTRVAMAVLVQESIDDDVVDGVAITANPFNEGRPGIFLNAQVAGGEGGSVTSARGDEVPEQILYYTYGEDREFERLSRSTLAPNGRVLTDDEVFALATALQAVHRHFNPVTSTRYQPMDVEFLLAGRDRHLVLVQARPYAIRWDEGREAVRGPE